MNQIDLQSRVAVITGGARDIGLATAERVLRSGGAVSLWDEDEIALYKAQAKLMELGEVATRTVELTCEAAVREAANATLGDFGKIDILVNNTRAVDSHSHAWELSPDLWRHEIERTLIVPFLTCRAVIPAMRKARYGRIVNVVPLTGNEDSLNGHHKVSRAGLAVLTRTLGKELAAENILVNCVTAAAADISMHKRNGLVDDTPTMISTNGFVRPDKVAATIGWLASEDCSVSPGHVHEVCAPD